MGKSRYIVNIGGTVPSSGQLAVGLAFGFVCILAMFGLVFQSSLNTIDKTKLQTTSDYAALVAADVQHYNLNAVRLANQMIEIAWLRLEKELNVPYCNKIITACETPEGGANYTCVGPKALGQMSSSPNETGTQASAALCDSACDQYDKKIKNDKIREFKAIQSQFYSIIMSSIDGANDLAFDQALNVFLDPKSLPSGLFAELEHKLGHSFKTASVRREYADGNLSNNPDYAYQIMDRSKDDPLFFAQQESRTTYHSDFYYQTVTNPVDESILCYQSLPIGEPAKPLSMPYRVTRAGDYTTQFFTGIKYMRPPSIIEKMLNIGIKNPDTKDDEFGQEVKGTSEKEKLFSRHALNMYAMSAAKPYGGEFPKSGDITGNALSLIKAILSGDNLSVFGSSGKDFKGSKLIGIADKDELGGVRIERADSCIDQVDDRGNVVGCIPYFAEDFLH